MDTTLQQAYQSRINQITIKYIRLIILEYPVLSCFRKININYLLHSEIWTITFSKYLILD